MRVYVDGVMLINFLVDFLLLLGTNRLTGFPDNKKCMAAASVLGALYSGVCLLPELRFLGNLLWRVVVLALMGGIAFGWNRSAVKRCGVFLLLGLALGGFSVLLGRADIWGLALASAGIWLLSRMSFDAPVGSREYIPLMIRYGDRSVNLLALRDTGNTLRDPITGEQALVITADCASRLTGLSRQQIRAPLETVMSATLPGLRLIPFHTVGQGSGVMLAMSFDQVVLGGREGRVLVAFSPENFGKSGAYQALTGGGLS